MPSEMANCNVKCCKEKVSCSKEIKTCKITGMVTNTNTPHDLGTEAYYYIQTTGYVCEHYSEMVRLSCYYSYKDTVLRKTLINDPLHTCFDCSVEYCAKCHQKLLEVLPTCYTQAVKKKKKTKKVNIKIP